MSESKIMLKLLEQMVESADKWDKRRVFRLSREYDRLSVKVYPKPSEQSYQSENCRNTCLASVGLFKDKHEESIKEARRLLSELRNYL